MNCRGYRQRFLPLPDLSRKIEGDSVRRVVLLDRFDVFTSCMLHLEVSRIKTAKYGTGNFC